MSCCRCSRARSTMIRDVRLWHQTDFGDWTDDVRSRAQSRPRSRTARLPKLNPSRRALRGRWCASGHTRASAPVKHRYELGPIGACLIRAILFFLKANPASISFVVCRRRATAIGNSLNHRRHGVGGPAFAGTTLMILLRAFNSPAGPCPPNRDRADAGVKSCPTDCAAAPR